MGPSLGTVIVLPGGRPSSWEKSRAYQLANIRMRPIANRIRQELGDSFVVHQVQYRFRGWNPPDLPAVSDAIASLSPPTNGPVVLVGHSMGGRVAAHVSSQTEVAGIVALAPWWPENDGSLITAPHLVTIHGTTDRWTDPRESRVQTSAARARGIDATYHAVDGAGHFMLGNPRMWHDLVCDAVIDIFAAHGSFRV